MVGSVSLEENMVADFLVEDVELVRLFEKEDDYLEKSRLLMNAYNQLSANQRNAIYLYFIKEFSWDEMAVSLDIKSTFVYESGSPCCCQIAKDGGRREKKINFFLKKEE